MDEKFIGAKITNINLKKNDSKYLLDIELEHNVCIENILLCNVNDIHNIIIKTEHYELFPYRYDTSYISGLFGDKLKLIGDCYLIQKEKEMTLEEIEKELGYPVKIVKEK